ncbi:MAG TPA: hypothetical protein VES01_07700 [Dermatophilaceae bacterium]|nr:hypothetical protein [Dermatophilaceae bacterium]
MELRTLRWSSSVPGLRHAAAAGSAAAGLITLLSALLRHTRQSWHGLGRPGVTPEDYVVTVAGCLAVLLVGWLLIGLTLATLTLLPGVAGRNAHRLNRRLVPAVLRRWLVVLLGSAVGLGGTAAAHAGPGPSGWSGPRSGRAAALAAPPWEAGSPSPSANLSAGLSVAVPARGTARSAVRIEPLPDPGWQGLDAPPGPGPDAVGSGSPELGIRAGRPGPPGVPPTTRAGGYPGRHLVRVGDCLWSIAGARLPTTAPAPAIDREWRRWYERNRPIVGPDPDLILPGRYLLAPAPKQAENPLTDPNPPDRGKAISRQDPKQRTRS